MEATDVTRLKETQDESLEDCKHRISQWKKFETDYTKLYAFLENVTDKLSHQVMVPFGKFAFMPGQLVDTNNVLALLGDNWFVERSTKDARGIVQRRINACQETLIKLEEEQARIVDWKKHTVSAMEDSEFKEIREEYEETMKPSRSAMRKEQKLNHLSDQKRGTESSSRIRWQEDQGQPVQITFHHSTQSVSFDESSNKTGVVESVLSPGDIIRVFAPKSVQPKPILKTSKTDRTSKLQRKQESVPNTVDAPIKPNVPVEKLNQAFTGTIVEKNSKVEQETEKTKSEPSRPTSRFKARRTRQ